MDIFDLLNSEERVDVSNIQPIDLIKDNEIFIPKNLWLSLIETYSREEIIKLLNRAVDEYNIPFPYVVIPEEKAFKDFEDLKGVNSFDQFYFDKWHSKKLKTDKWGSCLYDNKSVMLGRNYKGLKASDRFQNVARMECGHCRNVSPMHKWSNLRSRTSMWKPMWSLNMEYIDKSVCMKLIRTRGYVASQFRPASAKAVYDVFGAKRVLDFCSGWGDRLAGFYASNAEEYVGIDPNTALHSGYKAQAEFYGGHKKTRFFCSPAEDTDLSEYKEYFDLAFTSPPYFIQETYCQEDTQSWIRYKDKPQGWLEDFLFKAITNAWNSLRMGGRLVINIADVLYYSRDYLDICHQMNNFIETLPNAKYEGVIGYELAQRMGKDQKGSTGMLSELNGDVDLSVKPAEPMWVWSKGEQDPISFAPKELWEL